MFALGGIFVIRPPEVGCVIDHMGDFPAIYSA